MTELNIRPQIGPIWVLGGVLTGLMLVIGAAAVWVIAFLIIDPAALGRSLSQATGFVEQGPRLWQSMGLAALSLMKIGLWLAAVFCGRQVFAALQNEDVDAAATAARRVARILWAVFFVCLLTPVIGTLIATSYYPVGERAFSISFGQSQITTALGAIFAALMAHALAFGAELWRDHNAVI